MHFSLRRGSESKSKQMSRRPVARPAAETLQAWPERMQLRKQDPFSLPYNISIDVYVCVRRKGRSLLNRNALATGSKNYAGAAVETHATPRESLQRELAVSWHDDATVCQQRHAMRLSSLLFCIVPHHPHQRGALELATSLNSG